jgi:hypothetical protein
MMTSSAEIAKRKAYVHGEPETNSVSDSNTIARLVLLQVVLPRFCVASTKPESALDRSQG